MLCEGFGVRAHDGNPILEEASPLAQCIYDICESFLVMTVKVIRDLLSERSKSFYFISTKTKYFEIPRIWLVLFHSVGDGSHGIETICIGLF